MVQAARGHSHEIGHRPIKSIPETQTLRTQVVFAGSAVGALAADARRGLRYDAVTLAKPGHAGSQLRNRSCELVSEDHRHVDRPAVRVVILMNLAAADANRLGFEQHLAFARVQRLWNF